MCHYLKNFVFYFVLFSLIRIFDLRSKILSLTCGPPLSRLGHSNKFDGSRCSIGSIIKIKTSYFILYCSHLFVSLQTAKDFKN